MIVASPITLTVGAGHIDRVLADAKSLLVRYRKDTSADYLDYQPVTSRDCLFPEDAAVTLLVNSRADLACRAQLAYVWTLRQPCELAR